MLDVYSHLAAIGRALKKSVLHLAYPTRCLHCHTLLPPDTFVLCASCASLLELINPQERCRICFNPIPESPADFPCQDCLHHPSLFTRMGAVFNYEGPAASLMKRLKYANQPYLARGMAAFLVAQLDQLEWPLPDALIPVPLSFMHWLGRGYNQSALLAEEMRRFLQCPTRSVLKRRSGDYSQAALSLEQRQALDGERFKLKKNSHLLQDKVLLVIDDVMTSGSTLQRCAEELSVGRPKALYALTFCRTLSHDKSS
jgi:ComF family protein